MTAANNFVTKYFQKWADDRPRQYVSIWVTSWTFAAWSFAGIFWGWNVWVDYIYEIFYDKQPKTMGRGQVVYAFSLMLVIACWGLGALSLLGGTRPGLEISIPFYGKTKRFLLAYYWLYLFFCPLGLCLMGVAVTYKQIWLLYIGCCFYGVGFVFGQPFGRAIPTIAYKKKWTNKVFKFCCQNRQNCINFEFFSNFI